MMKDAFTSVITVGAMMAAAFGAFKGIQAAHGGVEYVAGGLCIILAGGVIWCFKS